jgi:ribosomal protein S18 acetylase RimI-like enzyme
MTGPTRALEDARAADPTSVLELTAAMRRALVQRGEHLGPSWPEEAARDLSTGSLAGRLARSGAEAIGLGILAPRGDRGYGQIHVAAAGERVAIAEELFADLVAHAPGALGRADVGVSGLTAAEEATLAGAVALRPDTEIIRRFALRRGLDLDHPPRAAPLPEGFRYLPVRTYPPAALARLDWAAFRGSPDAAFIAESPRGALRLLEGILAGQLGRFLEEASFVVADGAGALAGFLLTVEESPRVGVFVDLAVEPSQRRRGVARALLVRGLRGLLALGHTTARLWVTEGNAPARALYEALDFRPDATSYIYRWRRASSGASAGASPHSER